MSGDSEQEYFSDGMTEEIITALSRVSELFVIARNSTFAYKAKSVDVKRVGQELGVKYVLEGSVRKGGDTVRITAQLIDSTTGHHLWAQRYDRELEDIFAVQDEITMKIVTALQVTLTEGEQARKYENGTNNLDSYLKVLESRYNWFRGNKEANIRARQLAEQAIALDPEYPDAYAALGWTYYLDIWLGWSDSPVESMSRAYELAQKCITLDESNANAHRLSSWLFLVKREHEKAIAQAEKAVTLDPNSADARAGMGMVLYFAGRLEEAILSLKKAIRINPIPPTAYLQFLGMAYRDMGLYEEAITACGKALVQEPDNFFAHLTLTATYSMQGREDTARVAAAEVLRIDPEFSVEHFAKTLPHIDPANTARFADALRKAGLK
jgi:TolB-like protein/lipoprotein NlpI